MSHTLDKIDTQILAILQKDSNRTTKSIAKELGMTTSPVFERIKKLEKEGYIKKYVAVLDNKKVGLKLTVFIGITLQGHTRSYLKKFVTEINNFPEIAECHRVSGNYDYLLKLIVEDIQAYETFLISKLTLLPYLGNVHSLITLSTGKETNEIDLSRI